MQQAGLGSGVVPRRLVVIAVIAGIVVALAAVTPGTASARSNARATNLQLVLPLQAHYAALARYTRAVTTPGSPLYAQYRSIAWLARRFGASASATARVVRYLRRSGAEAIRVDATGLFVDARLRATTAERLFGPARSTLDEQAAISGGAAAPRVTIPSPLRGLVTGVVGLDTEPIATAPRTSQSGGSGGVGAGGPTSTTSAYTPVSGTPSGCAAGTAAGGFTPSQYLTAYDYVPLQQTGVLGQDERVALIEIDGYKASDIDTFAKCFGLSVPRIEGFGVGVSSALPPGGEATLDLEVLDATAPDLRSIDVYESKPDASDVLMALTAPLQTNGYKPQVISASLGLCESQTEQAVGRSGVDATEAALQEAADSGISFIAASGDYGSADCVSSNSNDAAPDPDLAVNYPASSPYATGVGGTNVVLTAANAIESQVVWNDGNATTLVGASGGGFSTLFARPGYQTGTVVQNHRAVPDVALLADVAPGYDVYCSAEPDCLNQAQSNPWQTVGGTSAATPLLAGGLALVDELLLQHQLQGLGLVNPLLYEMGRNPTQAPLVFDGVTTGSNDVGPFIQADGAALGCCTAGPGYNEATGWGGVNLAALANAALAAEPPIADVAVTLPQSQRPLKNKHILATVACSSACLFTSYGKVTIGHQKPFLDHSALSALHAGGQRTVKIKFSKGQLSRLRKALAAHTRVTAIVTGAIVDPAFDIERQSPQAHLVIRH